MSAELLEIESDDNCTDIGLEMKASGHAWLTLVDDEVLGYHLIPNEDGWKKAEAIAAALQEWIAHTKRLYGEVEIPDLQVIECSVVRDKV